jgi:hypothetical protein
MMQPPNHNSDKALWLIIFILALFFAGNFIFTQYEISQIKNNSISNVVQPIAIATNSPITISTPLPTSTPIAVASPTPKVIIVSSTPQATVQQITYIPLSGGNTQSTDWVNVSGTQFTMNFGDYGGKAYAVWDANLHVDNANGQTFARLFDETHSIAVNGSEISVTNMATSMDETSSALSFWAGNNTYIVQLKSLNGSTAFMDSGRIKITY